MPTSPKPVERLPYGRGARVTWHRGSIQPYSSIWVTVQRFLLLNRPTSAAFEQDFFVDPTRKQNWASLNGNGPVFGACAIRTARFARVLGEPRGVFDWSYVRQYPAAFRPLFRGFAACPACLAEGFHSVLYSLKGLLHCPVHSEKFFGCDRCGDRISARLAGRTSDETDECPCGRLKMPSHAARRPAANNERDEALATLTQWIVAIGKRGWFDLGTAASDESHIEQWQQHFRFWQRRLGLPAPLPWWPPATWATQGHVCTRYVQYGGLETVTHPSKAPDLRVAPSGRAPSSTGDLARDASATFKSMKRYLLRHVLRNRRGWMARMAASSDADVIGKSILAGNEEVRCAWALLIWWQTGVHSLSLRDWFGRQRFCFVPRHNDSRPGSMDESPDLRFVDSEPVRAWIAQWRCASALLRTWEAAVDRARNIKLVGDVQWGRGVAWGHHNLQCWSAAREEGGRIGLYVECPRAPLWHAAPRLDKEGRQQRWLSAMSRRFKAVAALVSAECIWYDSRTMDWTTRIGPMPTNPPECRQHRMLPPSRHLHFTVFPWAGTDDPGSAFVARCIGLPLACTGPSAREAIRGLKFAVDRYLRAFPAQAPASTCASAS